MKSCELAKAQDQSQTRMTSGCFYVFTKALQYRLGSDLRRRSIPLYDVVEVQTSTYFLSLAKSAEATSIRLQEDEFLTIGGVTLAELGRRIILSRRGQEMQDGRQHVEGELRCELDGDVSEPEKLLSLSLPRADAWMHSMPNVSENSPRVTLSMAEVIEVLSTMGVSWAHADAWSEQVEVFIPSTKDFASVSAGFFPNEEDLDRRIGMMAQLSEDAGRQQRTVTVVRDLESGAPVAMMVDDRYLVAQGSNLTLYKKIHEYGAFEPKYEQVLEAAFGLQLAVEVERVEADLRALAVADVAFDSVVAAVTTSGADAERIGQLSKGARNLLLRPKSEAEKTAGHVPH